MPECLGRIRTLGAHPWNGLLQRICATNEEAQELALSCPSSAYLGHDSAGRAAVVQAIRAGRIKRIYCNRMLTEGFDEPRVATIYVDKEPGSELLIYQMIGRGLRRKPDGGHLTVYAQDIAGVLAALERAG